MMITYKIHHQFQKIYKSYLVQLKQVKLMSRLNRPLEEVVHKREIALLNVMRLIDNIRQYGHLKAGIYPVNPPERKHVPKLGIEDFDLDQQTLEQISAGIVSEHFEDIYDNAYEAIVRMENAIKGQLLLSTLTLITTKSEFG